MAGDSWTKVANDVAPGASAAAKAAFARTLACRNALDANCGNDSLTATLAVGRLISYLPGDVPSATAPTTSSSTSTTVRPTTTTAAPATVRPTTTSSTSTTTGPAPARFVTLPPGAALPSEATCAAQVKRSPETRPSNAVHNATKATQNGAVPGVTGNYAGTTDEIIQWAACTKGIDEDLARAQAAVESWWDQETEGDFGSDATACAPGHTIGSDGQAGLCPQSIGLTQVRYPYHQAGFRDGNATKSTAYNAQYLQDILRRCFNGEYGWLNDVEHVGTYAAGDMWGCVGMWFSGRWHTPPAEEYIARVKDYLARKVWTTSDFLSYRQTGPTPTTTPSASTSTAAPTTSTGTSTTAAATSTTSPSPTGCGSSGSAFCADFSAGADPTVWSVSRVVGEVVNQTDLQPWPTTAIPDCRAGVTQVSAGAAPVACTGDRAGQLLVAHSAQNYGLMSLMPYQPFDFAGRTGRIEFDVDLWTTGGLGSWTSLFLTDTPQPVASSEQQVLGYKPANGFGVTFDATCNQAGRVGVGSFTTYAAGAETKTSPGQPCIAGQVGQLQHVVVDVSATRVKVTVGSTVLLDAPVQLGFTRGWLHLQTAERAPAKYGLSPNRASNYWAGVRFDGPAIPAARPSRVQDNAGANERGTNIGYALSSPLSLSIQNVPASPATAVLTAAVQFQYRTAPTLAYRLNGGPSHPVPFDAAEQSACDECPGPTGGAGVAIVVPVAVAELRAGANTIEFSGTGQTGGWPYIVSNVTLLTGGGTSTPSPTSTSTTSPPSSTASSTSSTSTSTTPSSSTSPGSSPTTTSPAAPGCGLAAPAYCETFDRPMNGGTQTGDLDPIVWGVSRLGDSNAGGANGYPASHNPCSPGAAVYPPNDVRICGGQLVESVNDAGAVVNLDTYPKQPFDWAGRTGTVVFDVSGDSDGNHGAWPEFVITDEPVPGVRRCISECNLGRGGTPTAQNQIGFSLAGGTAGPGGVTGVDVVFSAKGGVYADLPFTPGATITKGSRTAMNHIEVKLSSSRLEVWGTDAGKTTLKLLASADLTGRLAPTFTRGLVWLNDVHYNARKAVEPCGCGTQFDHFFAWDNLGFDGPKTYRDRGYDVPLAKQPGGVGQNGDPSLDRLEDEGYKVGTGPLVKQVTGVELGQATSAKVVLNTYSWADAGTITVRVNGGAPVTRAISSGFHWDSFSLPIPLGDIRPGTNTLTFTSNHDTTLIANPTLILVAADPVP